MHALSGCDTVSYPYGKGKKSALNVLMNTDIDGLQDALGEPDISQGQLKATAGAIFLALYGQKKTDSLNTARCKMYMSRKRPPPLKKLPPTDNNLQLYVLRAHLQIMLWKAADKSRRSWHPPFRLGCQGRWGCYTICVQCTGSEKRCNCHRAGLSCTEYSGRRVLQSLQ